MKIIIYECGRKNTLSGGFGDRIVGMVSTLSLCKKYDCDFLIDWNDSKIEDFFYFKNYKDQKIEGKTAFFWNHSKHGMEKSMMLPECDNLFFNTNQSILSFIKEHENIEMYEKYSKELYQELFDKHLIPKEDLLKKVDSIIKEDMIGIQLRTGDFFMNRENRQIGKPCKWMPFGTDINILKNYLILFFQKNSKRNIFITSDFNLKKIIKIEDFPNLIYYDKLPVHLERSIDKSNIDKCYIDFLVLTKCKELYITHDSNFGRCASLINKNHEVKGLKLDRNNVIE